MIDLAQLEGEDGLLRYQIDIVKGFRVLIARLGPSRLDETSFAAIRGIETKRAVEIGIVPKDESVPPLTLTAKHGQCILGIAEGEYLECHTRPDTVPGLAEEVLGLSERYLSGTTVVEHLNRRGRVVRKECFFGLETESDASSRIARSTFPLVFPKAIHSVRRHTFRCFRAESTGE